MTLEKDLHAYGRASDAGVRRERMTAEEGFTLGVEAFR
jgi:hypothetical protein